jgi:hypothetical protein
MNPNYIILLAFTLGTGIRILSNPWILGFTDDNYSVHINKIYDSIFVGTIVGIVQVLMNNSSLTLLEETLWIILFITINFIMNYIIKNQLFVSEVELLLQLKENYAESVKYSEIQLKNPSIDSKLKDFLIAHNKLKAQSINEINSMIKMYK